MGLRHSIGKAFWPPICQRCFASLWFFRSVHSVSPKTMLVAVSPPLSRLRQLSAFVSTRQQFDSQLESAPPQAVVLKLTSKGELQL